jgi:predicted metalloprotease
MRFRRGARLDPSQVEDYRGTTGPSGRSMGKPIVVGGGGLAGIIVAVILLISALSGGGGLGDLGALDDQAVGTGQPPANSAAADCQSGAQANEREDCRIVAFVNSIQAYWSQALRGYEPVTTRFFDGSISTGCGEATSAVGPFYCPIDRHVYIDLGFFDQLQSDFGAQGGPLAEAYVLAHEYGHHVQDLLGDLQKAQQGGTGPQSGAVRLELQADCYAGVWARNAVRTGLFEQDFTREDIAQALDAAAAVGDDRIQERIQGRVTPESWTHGSSEQRRSWFARGLESGNPNACDTFRSRL